MDTLDKSIRLANRSIVNRIVACILTVAIMLSATIAEPITYAIGLAKMAEAAEEKLEGYSAIYTIEDMYAIRANPSGNYILMNDIDLSETALGGDWDCGNGWSPIPNFSGVLEGNGHAIYHLNMYGDYCDDGSDHSEYIGFISKNQGKISNLYFKDVNIDLKYTGSNSNSVFGVIAADLYAGEIKNCSVEGKIALEGFFCSGGLVGVARGYKQHYSYDANLQSYYSYIDSCYVTADIMMVNPVGGYNNAIVGYNYTYSSMTNCYFDYIYEDPMLCLGTYVYSNDVYVSNCVNNCRAKIMYKRGEKEGTVSCSNSYYKSGAEKGMGGTALAPALMKIAASYVNLDLDSIWELAPDKSKIQLKQHPEISITGIRITSLPVKTMFIQNETIDVLGGQIEIETNVGNGYYEALTTNMVSGVDTSKIGKQIATVTYKGFSTTYEVEILPIEVSQIELSSNSIFLNKGKTAKIYAIVSPVNATDKSITWSSENESIASVDDYGVVTANNAGITKIYATASNGISAACKVEVHVPATNVAISEKEIVLEKGTSKPISVIMQPEDTTDHWTVTYSDNTICSVNDDSIYALNAGETTITITTQSGCQANCKVKVFVPSNGISLSEETIILNRDDTKIITALLNPIDSTDPILWKSSNTAVAMVENGNIIAVSEGECDIVAYTNDEISASCHVVVENHATNLQLSKTKLTLEKGASYTLIANVTPFDTKDVVQWTSSDEEICEVSSKGELIAKNVGEAIITCEVYGIICTCDVSVIISAKSLMLDKAMVEVEKGDTFTLSAGVTPANSTSTIVWTSSDNDVASVDQNGIVTAKAGGTATIIAKTDNGLSASCEVKVISRAIGIDLLYSTLKLNKGDECIINAVLKPYDSTDSVILKSSDPTVVSVNNNSIIAQKVGTAVITATTTSGISDTCEVIVENNVTSISFLSKYEWVSLGYVGEQKTVINPIDFTDKIVWKTSNSNVCTVDSKGNVKAVGLGEATITAMVNGLVANCRYIVALDADNISLNKKSVELGINKTYTLSATLTPANATSEVTWGSSDTTVASVNSNGVVTGKKVGKVTITAKTDNGKFATCIVSVIIPATSLSISCSSTKMIAGNKYTLNVSKTPANSTDGVTWSSSDTTIATVDKNGNVAAKKAGKVTFTAKATSGVYKKYTVTIEKPVIRTTWHFADIVNGSWYAKAVEYCFAKKYINGVRDNMFEPTSKLTRGMMVTILWNIAGSPAPKTTTKYKDITNTTAYYYKAVQWASEKKVVSGFADGSFGPSQNITREQLACMIQNFAKYQGLSNNLTTSLSTFSDSSKISGYALSAVKWSVANKIISGKNGGKEVDPKGNASRAEAATMIMNYCVNLAGQEADVIVTKSPIPFTITYVLNGGTQNSNNPKSFTVNSSTLTLYNPTKSGYTFGGWYKEKEFKTKVTKISSGTTGNITLYARWSSAYKITYVMNGGENSYGNPNQYSKDTETIVLLNPRKKGYIFDGWYTDSSYTKRIYNIPKGSTGDLTIYCKWIIDPYRDVYSDFISDVNTRILAGSTIAISGPRTWIEYRVYKDGMKIKEDEGFMTNISIPTSKSERGSVYSVWVYRYKTKVDTQMGLNRNPSGNYSYGYITSEGKGAYEGLALKTYYLE